MSQDFKSWTRSLKSLYGITGIVVADKRNMGRDTWLSERKLGVGGSDIGKILGHSKYGTRLDVWLDKLDKAPIKEISEEQQMILDSGTDMEELILDLYRKKTGRKVVAVNAILSHPDYPMARVNVDAIVQNEEGDWGVLEVKNTLGYGEEWKNGSVPLSYEDQCRYGMWICGLKFGEVVSLRSGRWTDSSRYLISHDISWEINTADALVEFWKYVELGIQPSFSQKDDGSQWMDTLKSILTEKPFKEVLADELLEGNIQAYKDLSIQSKEIDRQLESIKAYFADVLQGEGAIESSTGTVTWKKSKGTSTFDRKTFEKENHELAQRYVTVGECSMRMTVK